MRVSRSQNLIRYTLGNLTKHFSMHRAPAAMVTRPEPANVSISQPRDPNTLSNYNNFKTTNTAVDLKIDFQKQTLSGLVSLTLKSLTEGETDQVILDSRFDSLQFTHITRFTHTIIVF